LLIIFSPVEFHSLNLSELYYRFSQVSALFKEYGISKFSVQVEKEAFFHHMSALSAGYKSVLALKQGADMGLSSVAGEFDYGLIKAV